MVVKQLLVCFCFSIHSLFNRLADANSFFYYYSYIHRRTSFIHGLRCIPLSLCCSSSCYRRPTFCANSFCRIGTTSISYRWIFTCISLVQSYPSTCNDTYLDTDIILSLDITDYFSGKSFSSFKRVRTLMNTVLS